MNILQGFRRLGQQMKGWQDAMNMQDAQLLLVRKLYAKHELEIVMSSPACPEQYEVFKGDKQVAYYRLRHGEFRVDYPTCGDETIYEAQVDGDGIFYDSERLVYLSKAMRCVLSELNKS